MVLLDSNIFIIDRFFQRDAFYPANRAFIDRLHQIESGVSIFSLYELCGIASFNLSQKELHRWLGEFPSVYGVRIVSPFGIGAETAETWAQSFFLRVGAAIAKRMSLGDAVLLTEAESYKTEAIITWNTKDFARKTRVPVWSPKSYLQQ